MGTLEKGIALMIPQESGSGGETIKGKTIQTSGQAVGEYIWLSSNSNAWTTISSCIPQVPPPAVVTHGNAGSLRRRE
ncbi:hypothetical protein CTA1_9807 [Colletotrichum tanaceti]|uniref:Uncharacterized protein n=1 Tax=Colletotrichum tanaceti TaxID=1306861 RepID=A0A4V6DK06_9PEZI|nr:hypothetical protein CTA1_9807 [Colletotrichum tanaceti]